MRVGWVIVERSAGAERPHYLIAFSWVRNAFVVMGASRSTVRSEALHRRIAGSELIIYPDSGHGGIFQFHDTFAPLAVEFLAR